MNKAVIVAEGHIGNGEGGSIIRGDSIIGVHLAEAASRAGRDIKRGDGVVVGLDIIAGQVCRSSNNDNCRSKEDGYNEMHISARSR